MYILVGLLHHFLIRHELMFVKWLPHTEALGVSAYPEMFGNTTKVHASALSS